MGGDILAVRVQRYERDGLWICVPTPLPLRQVIRGALLNALAFTGGHQRQAAHALGIAPRKLWYMLDTYDIPRASTGR